MSHEQLVEYEKEREQTTVGTFARLDASEECMVRGERSAVELWLTDAGTMAEDFRVTRQLFLADRVSPSGKAFLKHAHVMILETDMGDMRTVLVRNIPWCGCSEGAKASHEGSRQGRARHRNQYGGKTTKGARYELLRH
jgi:hypothetical protein